MITLDLAGLDDGLPDTHLDCSTSTYARVLRVMGLEPAILGDDFRYRYAPRRETWPLGAIQTRRGSHDDVVFRWYGVRGTISQHRDPGETWDHVRSVLGDGRPVIASVDLFEWPRSTFQHTRHHPHRVLIAGHRAGEALVVDGRSGRRMIQWLPVEVIDRAMGSPELRSTHEGFHGRHVTVDLPRPGTGPAAFRQRGATALAEAAGRYLRPPPDAERSGTRVRGGWDAVRAFLPDFTRYFGELTELPPERTVPAITFFGRLNAQRLFNALLIERAAADAGAGVAGCAEAFRVVGDGWGKLYHAALYGFHAGRDMPALLRRLAPRVEALAHREHDAIVLLDERLAAGHQGAAHGDDGRPVTAAGYALMAGAPMKSAFTSSPKTAG
ncbi:MAG: BtrH N-terminal domain-containing protein [Streptosporangiaceae bacterium]